ncbi:V-type H+-transporting ATPase subunit B [Canna indica]|uniref:V-type H+-transporting ATPase subunit B n=1 Tax=Canna indica TaxID=4628 RepID=A0AAQ3Q9S7_9LILI|nr:V-type H+-transporting ATPase subunit B [Canna indica]
MDRGEDLSDWASTIRRCQPIMRGNTLPRDREGILLEMVAAKNNIDMEEGSLDLEIDMEYKTVSGVAGPLAIRTKIKRFVPTWHQISRDC